VHFSKLSEFRDTPSIQWQHISAPLFKGSAPLRRTNAVETVYSRSCNMFVKTKSEWDEFWGTCWAEQLVEWWVIHSAGASPCESELDQPSVHIACHARGPFIFSLHDSALCQSWEIYDRGSEGKISRFNTNNGVSYSHCIWLTYDKQKRFNTF